MFQRLIHWLRHRFDLPFLAAVALLGLVAIYFMYFYRV